jgi:hypothetical protein
VPRITAWRIVLVSKLVKERKGLILSRGLFLRRVSAAKPSCSKQLFMSGEVSTRQTISFNTYHQESPLRYRHNRLYGRYIIIRNLHSLLPVRPLDTIEFRRPSISYTSSCPHRNVQALERRQSPLDNHREYQGAEIPYMSPYYTIYE